MKKNNNFKKTDFFILFFIIIVALSFRLYKLNSPLADLHSWRQADTAAVAKNFVKIEFNLLRPRFDDLSSLQSAIGKENPEGLRFVEFPLYNAIFAFLFKYIPSLSIDVWGRLTSIFFSLITIAIIYYLSLKENGRLTAIVSSLVYSIFPFFVFFSRAIFPETMALSLCFMAIFFLYHHVESKKGFLNLSYFILSLINFTLSLLVKPTSIFYGLPLVFLFFRKNRLKIIKNVPFYLFFVVSVIPLVVWREYIKAFPEGIPPNTWLITHVNTSEGLKNIFFTFSFFRWIFYERISSIIFGGYLAFFAVLGVLSKQKKYLLLSIVAAAASYVFVFQGGNVQHEYYQILILPALAITVGLGVSFIFKNIKLFIHPVLSALFIILVFALSFLFSFYKVRDYYHYPEDLVQIAKVIQTLTKPEDKIVTDRLGDTTLLYLSNRRGAPAIFKNTEELKNSGYKYLVTQNQESIGSIKANYNYPIIFENNQFVIFELL